LVSSAVWCSVSGSCMSQIAAATAASSPGSPAVEKEPESKVAAGTAASTTRMLGGTRSPWMAVQRSSAGLAAIQWSHLTDQDNRGAAAVSTFRWSRSAGAASASGSGCDRFAGAVLTLHGQPPRPERSRHRRHRPGRTVSARPVPHYDQDFQRMVGVVQQTRWSHSRRERCVRLATCASNRCCSSKFRPRQSEEVGGRGPARSDRPGGGRCQPTRTAPSARTSGGEPHPWLFTLQSRMSLDAFVPV
jgi:hypothetical protein